MKYLSEPPLLIMKMGRQQLSWERFNPAETISDQIFSVLTDRKEEAVLKTASLNNNQCYSIITSVSEVMPVK